MRWLSMSAAVLLCACGSSSPDEGVAPRPNTPLRYLGGTAPAGYARAAEPRGFSFPLDHGSHPEYQTEWWYFTGNLAGTNGRHFGFELTFFRYAIAAADTVAAAPESHWRAEQIWMAHLAVTDSARGRFLTGERVAREALDLAGANTDPLRVWVRDWSLEGEARPNGGLDARLDAREERFSVTLALQSASPVVAQGDEGLSRKGSEVGNASYYYSVPRLAARGAIEIDGERLEVAGTAWMDREWGTSALEEGLVGWDWFALHLNDGASLMFYRLRRTSGEASSYSAGSLLRADGTLRRLLADDVTLVPLAEWRSPATRVSYPISWRLAVPSEQLELTIRPYLENQELDLSVRYWEGAVRAEGSDSRGAISAQGYLELTGY